MCPGGNVTTRALFTFTQTDPSQMCWEARLNLQDGRKLTIEKEDYLGFYRQPAPWEGTVEKFRKLGSGVGTPERVLSGIVECVGDLKDRRLDELIELLRSAHS